MSHYEPSWDAEGNPEVGTWVREEPDCPPCNDSGMRNGRRCADCNPNRWQRLVWAVSWRIRRAVRRPHQAHRLTQQGSDQVVIVHTPDRPHRCGPNEYGYWDDGWHDPAGTVRECAECGKSWVAYRPITPGYMGVLWRREGWLARRRRVRAGRGQWDEAPF